jgi:hypothetical protein
LTPAGALDPTFASAGVFSSSGTTGGGDFAIAVQVDAMDRPVIEGTTDDGNGHEYLAVWRLTP